MFQKKASAGIQMCFYCVFNYCLGFFLMCVLATLGV